MEKIRELVELAQKRSPVFDIISHIMIYRTDYFPNSLLNPRQAQDWGCIFPKGL
jgi:hypothetical protein